MNLYSVSFIFYSFHWFYIADLLYTFMNLDRNLNFIEHTSQLGWKELVPYSLISLIFAHFLLLIAVYLIVFYRDKRAMPLIVDPGLYSMTKSDIFNVNPPRTLPTAFKLFTGSCSSINVYSLYLQLNLLCTIFVSLHISA